MIRLAAKVEVSALIRRVQAEGGHAAVLHRGDPDAGAILLYLAEKGRFCAFLERSLAISGEYRWQRIGPEIENKLHEINNFIDKRRHIDPDLWVVELDIAGVERFADEMTAAG